jgi:cytochrome c oxidase cbb3-type subunit 1
MNGTVLRLVLFTFLTGMASLITLIALLSRDRKSFGPAAARVIFEGKEEGQVEEPAAPTTLPALATAAGTDASASVLRGGGLSDEELEDRVRADQSSKQPVLWFLLSAVFWLAFGSVLGLIVSLKLTFPDWLVGHAAVTFGRLRPLHLNLVIYGWASMAGMAATLWLVPRLAHRPLVRPAFAVVGAALWNVGVLLGTVSLFVGITDGVEWLEYPFAVDLILVVAGALTGVPILTTLARRKAPHLYVSAWYLGAALLWFPILFGVANAPRLHFGVEHAVVNWWFAHNVLGLWLTPFGLGIAYYLIPKVLGRPVHSYGLSMVGFWSLAIFYSQVGMHHLIGGPVPTWLITVSIVHSVMMFLPVLAVAINHHSTMFGRFSTLRHSPVLRFAVVGSMMYTFTSFEGSLESLRAVNRVTHFTHFTVAHAHFGAYGFVSFELFAAAYFLLPRLLGREWAKPSWISVHFWTTLSGILVYGIGLSIGGILQGKAMLDGSKPFMASVLVTIPWLHARTVGGLLMTIGHLVFAANVVQMVFGKKQTAAVTNMEVAS